ncbi:MAG: TRAP transporter permease [Treponema sp.]|nr:TRAP transporter permease [Treponema sp.]
MSDIDQPISEAEAAKIAAQFDKESNVRNFTGVPDILMKAVLSLFAIYIFAVTLFITLPEQVRRCVFLGILIFIGYLLYPARKRMTERVNYIPWYDFILAVLAALPFFYYALNFEAIVVRSFRLTSMDIYMGIIGIVLLVELCRRVVGIPILVVVAGFITYAFISGYSLRRIIHQLFYTTEGVIGTPIQVASSFIVLFIFLASFLEKSGIAKFFIDLANSVAGFTSGGPAKVSVIASALLALITGSSVGNTVASGTITIPTMKKIGYKPHFAAAVEATASTGGQLMPPIMGAAAFLMAEMTAIPYPVIALSALFPAVLYFAGVFLMVHFEAKKLGLQGLPKDQLPRFLPLFIAKGYLFLPIVVLIALMAAGKTPAYAACFGILGAVVLSFIRKDTRFSRKTFVEAVTGGTRNTLSVAIACAMAGNVVGIVSMTGIGQKLIGQILIIVNNPFFTATGTSLFVALFFTMISCLVLGLGIPTTANYVIMATITAPMVIRTGAELGIVVPVLAAHMFVFYFGIMADITPPVALAGYAASAIAKCDPMKTAFTSTKLAIAAYLVPYMFIFNPHMLLTQTDTTPIQVIQIIITSLIGMFAIAAALEGFMLRKLALQWRLLAFAAGFLLIDPRFWTDFIGVGVIALIVVIQVLGKKREIAAQA